MNMDADVRDSGEFRKWLRKREAERRFLIARGFDAHSPVMEIVRDFLMRPAEEQRQVLAEWSEWESRDNDDADEMFVGDVTDPDR